eukprot:COSAG04_NODE_6474_length_1319_cov_2.468852_1_plen_215_part_00
MQLLLVGPSSSGSPLALLADACREDGHGVVVTHMPDSPDAAFGLMRGVDQIIIVAETEDVGQRSWLDTCSRGTYDLLTAAAESGVARAVVVSTLDLFLAVPAAFKIDPNFKPRPSTDPAQLSPHLTEFVAREFARGSPLSVVVARIGHLDSPSSRFWVSAADAMSGLLATINAGGGSDSITEHHHPGKYRVEHLLDPACEVLVRPALFRPAARS